MKRRIIGLVLVVVMLTLSLVGCGYSLSDEELGQYAKYDANAIKTALEDLEIEDGDYTTDEATRTQKVLDHIYETLAGKVDKDAKVTEGVVGAHDKLFYCYYVTADALNKDGKEPVLYATYMDISKAVSFQLGHSERGDLAELIESAVKDYDLTDKAYTTVKSGKDDTKEGKLAFVTYTQEVTGDDGKTKKTTYTNHPIILGNEGGDVGKALVGATIGTAVPNFKSEDQKTTYTNAKVNWVVTEGTEIVVNNKTYTATTSVKDTTGATHELKDVELTYHVYPVYYLEVEEFGVSSILRTLISNLSKDSLECLAECEAEIKTFAEKLDAFNKAETAYDDAVKAEEKAADAVKTAQEKYDAENAKTDKNETTLESYKATLDKANAALNDAKTATTTKKGELDTAKTALETAEGAISVKATSDKIVEEYKESVHDELLGAYNDEIKGNLAAAIWKVIDEKIESTGAPRKAVKKTYERLMESYKEMFYEDDYDSAETNYNHYNGNFEAFLVAKTGATEYKWAKDAVWGEAVVHVKELIKVYIAAEIYGQKLTDDEIKEYKKDDAGYYEAYESSYGEINTLAAYQFDQLMDYLLEADTDEETGKVTYKNIGYHLHEHEDKD